MKRLVFCFDGTWQKLTQQYPTNVALTAETVLPLAADAVAQPIFYDEGVGTDPREKWTGGIFGLGIMKVLADAYRFLIFNYEAGDQIFVFGFSRGAFTARSFVGLVSNCGILDQRAAKRSLDLITLYEHRNKSAAYLAQMMEYRGTYCGRACVSAEEDAWRVATLPGYVAGQAPILKFGYIGVWETVGALGVPRSLSISSWVNRKYAFHDLRLTELVKSARHAVAIDERRVDYSPTLWNNVDELNAKQGFDSGSDLSPYQQSWFPGDHGSVGGGGDRRGLSDQALEWIWDGARHAGLGLDISPTSPIFELRSDPLEALQSRSPSKGWDFGALIDCFQRRSDRKPGPALLPEVSAMARLRWKAPEYLLPEEAPYRPLTLGRTESAIDELPDVDFSDVGTSDGDFDIHVVEIGETLSRIAEQHYGDGKKWALIFDANRSRIADPDKIFIGQTLRIPKQI
jgi:uncharacterized protein (DUF2235 family)